MQFTPKAVAGYEQTVAKNIALWIELIATERHENGFPINLAWSIRLLQFESGRLLAILGFTRYLSLQWRYTKSVRLG